jgi:hypothetical protein
MQLKSQLVVLFRDIKNLFHLIIAIFPISVYTRSEQGTAFALAFEGISVCY